MTDPPSESGHEAVQIYQLIGQAVDIVMKRYQVSRDRAYARLVHVSRLTNVELQDIAQTFVDDANSSSRD